MSINIYLMGCISEHYRNNEYQKATDWRIKLIHQLLEDNAQRRINKWSWFDPTLNFEENYNVVNNKSVLQQNIHYLRKADIGICNLDLLEKSPGTLYEVFYFGEVLRKPIIAFGYSDWVKSPHVEPYITAHLKEDKIFTYLDNLYYQ